MKQMTLMRGIGLGIGMGMAMGMAMRNSRQAQHPEEQGGQNPQGRH